MIVSFFITDAQAAIALDAMGVKTKIDTVIEYRSKYHNKLEAVEVERLLALRYGDWCTAREVLGDLIKEKLLKTI